MGAYTLTLSERPAPSTQTPGTIAVGQTVDGDLVEGDAETDEGSPYDAWTLTAAEGERVALTLTSDDFDALLVVGRMVDGVFEELARNDDGVSTGEDGN